MGHVLCPLMAKTDGLAGTRFELVDRILGGQLAAELRRLKAENVTYDDMVDVFAERGISVSRETLRRWVASLDKEAVA